MRQNRRKDGSPGQGAGSDDPGGTEGATGGARKRRQLRDGRPGDAAGGETHFGGYGSDPAGAAEPAASGSGHGRSRTGSSLSGSTGGAAYGIPAEGARGGKTGKR